MVELGDLLDRLCAVLPDRRPGSPGNHQAVDLVAELLTLVDGNIGWKHLKTVEGVVIESCG